MIVDRSDILLQGLDLAHCIGAEIGPLDRPLVSKGVSTVYYIDYCDTETLRKRWATDPGIQTDKIHVDVVWGTKSLRESLASVIPPRDLDYVVASHVIEHVPDLIGWLQEVQEVLGPQGSLRLAIPDRRYTFDLMRTTSTLAEVLDAHVQKRRVPAPSRVLDFALNMVEVDCASAWQGTLDLAGLRHGFTTEQAIHLARDAEENGTYHDVHCWVFTPESFANLMCAVCATGLTMYQCDRIVGTRENTFEFYVEVHPCADMTAAASSWKTAIQTLRQ